MSKHAKSISCISVLKYCVVTGASDSTIKIWSWNYTGQLLECLDTISLKGRYPLVAALSALPNAEDGALALAIGTTDRNILLYVRSSTNHKVHYANIGTAHLELSALHLVCSYDHTSGSRGLGPGT